MCDVYFYLQIMSHSFDDDGSSSSSSSSFSPSSPSPPSHSGHPPTHLNHLLSSVLSFICPRSPLYAVARRRGYAVVDRQSSLANHHLPLTLMLPLLVDCCLFIPLVDGGGLGLSSAPPIQQTHPPPLVVTRKICCQGSGVVVASTSVPMLASGQYWPSPMCGSCTSESAPGRGRRAGMV